MNKKIRIKLEINGEREAGYEGWYSYMDGVFPTTENYLTKSYQSQQEAFEALVQMIREAEF